LLAPDLRWLTDLLEAGALREDGSSRMSVALSFG